MQSRNLKNILKESFWMATDSIRKNKLRSSLTLLGISIGVFSVIGVMTAIRTLESSVESGLNVFAANTFVIQKNPEFNFGGDRRKYNQKKFKRQISSSQSDFPPEKQSDSSKGSSEPKAKKQKK